MKKAIALITALLLLSAMLPAALAADEAQEAAQELYALGLFTGVGVNEDGTPDFDLEREPTRSEAVTMLVRLLGKEAEAKEGAWETPFTDVPDWAKPYVGYAYANKLTFGTGETTFGGKDPVSATQYLTFVLRALGYESGTDFQWNRAWELSDAVGMTDGRYGAADGPFLRGDVAIISRNALYVSLKGGDETLLEALGLAPEAEPRAWYETDENGRLFIRTNLDSSKWDGYTIVVRSNCENGRAFFDMQPGHGSIADYQYAAGLASLYWQEVGSIILSTDVIVLDDASLWAALTEQADPDGDFEKTLDSVADHIAARFLLTNRIFIEEGEEQLGLESFSLIENGDGTETYVAAIDGEINSRGAYGLLFRERGSGQYVGLSNMRRDDGFLTNTCSANYFAPPGSDGAFCVFYGEHRMEDNGDIICRVAKSNDIDYESEAEPRAWYETDENGRLFIRTNLDSSKWDGYTMMLRWNLSDGGSCRDNQPGRGLHPVFSIVSGLSWLYTEPRGTRILSTDVIVLEGFSCIDTVVEQIDAGRTFEEIADQFSSQIAARFTLENDIYMEITEDAIGFLSFAIEYNGDETETYTAYIDGEISEKGEYGLVFRTPDGKHRRSLSYIGKKDGCLSYTRDKGHFGSSGVSGTFYITFCEHRMEDNGDVVLKVSRSNGLEYTLP